ncbi:MAG: carboxy terminal-processing peptidase [Alcanivoracaceae bacterium]|nr:carboxy terminal-processing peptidase [Alcanivoracaceae bacterium]
MKFKYKLPVTVLAIVSAGLFTTVLACTSCTNTQASAPEGLLAPEAIHQKTIETIIARLSNHYRQVDINDALASSVLDQYLKDLDGNRMYFLASDVQSFAPYRTTIDDQLDDGDLTAGYTIFNLYRQRVRERVEYMLSLLDKGVGELNLSDDESLLIDRRNAPWAKDIEDSNTIWRKRLEDAVIAMRLDKETDEEIEKRLNQRYSSQLKRLDQSTSEDVFQLYVNALAQTYDPHTSYFTPHSSENFNISMSRSLEGIGAVLQAEDEYTKVVRLVPGGPAAKNGQLKPSDRIVGVAQGDDEMVNIIGWRLDEVVNLIRGPKGTRVRLEVIPAGSANEHRIRTIAIDRNRVVLEDQAAKSKIINVKENDRELKIGVIDIPAFYLDFDAYHRGDPDYTSTTRDVARLLMELQEKGIDGLVIDLRDNGGGSLQEATQLVSLFIDRGPTVQVRDARGRVQMEPDQYPGMLYFGPMSVLVNHLSASASEIFAGAMQDYGRALILGDETFGKGTVQTLIPLDHGQLKITQAKFYRVSGGSNQNKGIIPDISMPYLINKKEIGESALPNALPWDQIAPARYSLSADMSPYVESLRTSHLKRLAKDPEFDYVRAQMTMLEEDQARTTLSLNQAKREKQQRAWEARRLATENALRKSRGEKPIKEYHELQEIEEERIAKLQSGEESSDPDPYLKESGEVMGDLIELLIAKQVVRSEPATP